MKPGAEDRLPGRPSRLVAGSDTWVVALRGGLTLDDLRRVPGVTAVEADRVRTRLAGPDPLRSRQTFLGQISWSIPTGVRRPLVAVLDTGVDGRHPDLDGRIVAGWARSFVDDEPLVDRSGHGTHMAGLIGAETRNGVGGVGVANVRLLVVKIADAQGQATSATIIRGLRYAVDRGAKVVNLSFGGEGFSRAEQNAIYDARRRGVLVVAAAGNTGRDGSKPAYPGAYRQVLAVGAVRPDDAPILDSTQGAQVAIAAPGKAVLSTVPRGRYARRTGTSMATAIVSGVAAQALARRPNLEVSQLREMLVRSARDVGAPGRDDATGWGVVNLAGALVGPPPIPDGPEPNDDPALARRLPALLGSGGPDEASVDGSLESYADYSDDYRVWMDAGATIDVTATGPADGDVDLVVWKPGAPAFAAGPAYVRDWLAASALGPGPNETLSFTATLAGEYTVEVAAAVGRGRYALSVRRTVGPPPP